MTVELQPADVRGADCEGVVAFLTGNEWPFLDDDDHATFWLVEDSVRIGSPSPRT